MREKRINRNARNRILAGSILLNYADAIYDKYVAQFVEKMKSLKSGDPMAETTDVAPLSSENILRGVDEQVFADIETTDGLPDGLTVDADGAVWVCLFGGGRVRRYRPDGSLDREM